MAASAGVKAKRSTLPSTNVFLVRQLFCTGSEQPCAVQLVILLSSKSPMASIAVKLREAPQLMRAAEHGALHVRCFPSFDKSCPLVKRLAGGNPQLLRDQAWFRKILFWSSPRS